jgi:zinc/manganese transport system ATP-binding protein
LGDELTGMAGIRIRDLTLTYNRHPAVHHLSGEFAPGSMTAVVGPNGAGKSTLLGAIVGRIAAATGSIETDTRREQIAYLPQQAELDRSFPIRVLDVIMLGHWAKVGAFRAITAALRDGAREALAAVGLAGFEKRALSELSVGQLQRVLFARVLLQDARLILLDEPFSAIDARTTADLLQVVHRWHGERRTVIAVLHDHDQVRAHFPETLLLAREPVAWGPTAQALRAENLLRARRMAEAWDEQAPWCERGAA